MIYINLLHIINQKNTDSPNLHSRFHRLADLRAGKHCLLKLVLYKET